ncbi:MAG: fdrA domain protein [Clostridia bacterium]|nr:fdrA domain protein [Clostridia bacterium]
MNRIDRLFSQDLKVINIGLESFSKDLKKQEVSVVQLDWKPRAGGNAKLSSLLDRLKSNK